MKHERDIKKRIMLRWLAVAVNMLVIFLFSSQSGTSSGELSDFVAALVAKIPLTKVIFAAINIRKAAHFMIYLMLGILTYRALMLHTKRTKIRVLMALIICFCYALSDEFHQSFVPGRGPSFVDVMIDTCGALAGIMVCIGMKRRMIRKE